MKMFLLSLMLMSVIVFAEVHPALKEAVDSQNYKQAENLVKNVGIKDVYCPATLSAKDADKIYGKVFSDSIGFLLENCDSDFSKTYLEYKCAGGNDKKMCLKLVKFTDPYSWPETYVKQFCTKKNVDICVAAIERVPVEKSAPYLKTIKANGLAFMKEMTNPIAQTVKECRWLCEMTRQFKLSGQIDDDILKKRQEWRRARTVNEQEWIEQQIKKLENDKVAVRSEEYCDMACGGNQPETDKFAYYYFDRAFYSLSLKAAWYYKNLKNLIIPELAENWFVVDNLIEASVKDMNETVAKVKNLDLLNTVLNDFKQRIGIYKNYMTEKQVLDSLKASFVRMEKRDELELLAYCKIYPSLENDAEKLFGEKIINCKSLLDGNKKIFESCNDGENLFGGVFQCVSNQFVIDTSRSTEYFSDSRDGKLYSKIKIGNQIWMSENLKYSDSATYTGGCINRSVEHCSRVGRLYYWAEAIDSVGFFSTRGKGCGYGTTCSTKYSVRGVCPEGWHLPDSSEWEILFKTVGGKSEAGIMLKNHMGWISNGNGANVVGFSALPDYGTQALFWSSSEYDSNSAYFMLLKYNDKDAYIGHNAYKSDEFYVRCIKDEYNVDPDENFVTPEYGISLSEVSFNDDGSSAAASFFAGEKIMEKLKQYSISGNANEKNAKIKEMTSLIQTGTSFYEKATDDEKWYYPAKLQSGKLFIIMADQIKNQESNAKDEEEKFAENIVNSQKLPKYYDQAKNFFQRAIIHARVKGVTNEYVKALEEYYINMFFKSCSVFRQVQTDYLTSPLPDSASIVREYFRQGLSRCEDATKAAHEDLEKYREELFNRADQAKQKAVSQCAEGLKATKTYGIKTDQVDVLYDLLQELQK